MESCANRLDAPGWPNLLGQRLLPDARFARAYKAFGDKRRALVKAVIAKQYELHPPLDAPCEDRIKRYDAFSLRRQIRPYPFALLILDAPLDAPAFFLAALMPLLASRAERVAVVRLGSTAAVSDALLVSCELAGVEELAALGPGQLTALLAELAQAEAPCLVVHAGTRAVRRVMSQPSLRDAGAGALRFIELSPPARAGLWRTDPARPDAEAVALFYGALPFDEAGPEGSLTLLDFSAQPRDFLLAPEGSLGSSGASLTVSTDCLGLWRWPGLEPRLLAQRQEALRLTS